MVAALACAQPPRTPAAPSAASAEPDIARSLNRLGEEALAAGDLPEAKGRFERALAAYPPSLRARVGLARVARQQGDRAVAEARLAEVLSVAPDHYEALVQRAGLEADGGDRAGAVATAVRARSIAPTRPEAHALLAEWTGTAPPLPESVASLDVASRVRLLVQRASEHPYDPAAAVDAARALIDAGDTGTAARWLRGSWWMADRDPAAGLEAVALLKQIDPDWATRRVVPVYTFADDDIRSDPWWAMRMRFVWADLSQALQPLLDTVFVPVSVQAFSSRGRNARLESIRAAVPWGARLGGPPGIVAIFTERVPLNRTQPWRKGEAVFLGRHLTARLDPGSTTVNTTLVHEVLHLYGAVHVSPEFPSIMNPQGNSMQLDQPNTRIASLTRDRVFEGRGMESDVFAHVDEKALIGAYRKALALNIEARNEGMAEAVDSLEESRYVAARQARQATALDDHLGDVASLMAELMLRQGSRAGAVRYLDLASRLYGPRTPRGAQSKARADAILAAATR